MYLWVVGQTARWIPECKPFDDERTSRVLKTTAQQAKQQVNK
jgi:hypothetical protein